MILILDDDQNIITSLEVMLDELGEKYISFLSSEKALEYFIQKKGKGIDLIICDYMLPNMDGITFLNQLELSKYNIPSIMITAHDKNDVAISALEAGVYDYITKPINFKELAILCKRAMRQKEIKEENTKLNKKINELVNPKVNLIGKTKSMQAIKETINKVAKTNANVLITGETGTGKEVIAKLIHAKSNRSEAPLISVNCAAIPEHLLESELFGHKKGAFTGADSDKLGLFEEANNGIMFLDEIGDMPLQLQAKLLRVLQEGKIRKVGENKEVSVDVRVIAATHNNLFEKIEKKEFREDLFYRLNIINIMIPPLKERYDDIPLLVDFFLKKYCSKQKLTQNALKKLLTYKWPGNVRELENIIERACIMTKENVIDESDIIFNTQYSTDIQASGTDLMTLKENEKKYIAKVLEHTEFVKDKAAQILDINRKTLYRKIKEYDLE